MEEHATFEAQAVLAPRRARRARLALLVPVVALVATAWAGFSGGPSDQSIATVPDPTTVVAPSLTAEGSPVALGGPRPVRPGRVLGLDVQRLEDVQPRTLGRDELVVISGWYIATAITDCPSVVVVHRPGSLPEIRRDSGRLQFCERSGVLYASRPYVDESLPVSNFDDTRSKNAGLPAVAVSLAAGIVAPLELERIERDATEVIVIGRFVPSGEGCRVPYGCHAVLVVDHVAWTPGA